MSTPVQRDVIDYEPRPLQREVHRLRRKHRFGVIVCHRRFGKTVLAINDQIRGAATCNKPRPRLGYLAPTYTQGKATAFDYLRHYSSSITGTVVNQSELRVDFPTINQGQVRIYGADNPDSLRGLYFDDVVLDEYGLHQAKTFSEVIMPTLVDRGGSALFCGTPNGQNQFYEIAREAKKRQTAGDPDWFFREYKASDTNLLDPGFLASAKSMMTPDEYAQEFECSFEAAVKGAIFARELETARAAKRITAVPYDPTLPVDTDWDLGIGDAMAIWYSQSTRSGEIRLIDYDEGSGEGFTFYARLLASKRYVYGQHWAPHDIQVRELSSGRSRLEVAESLGIKFELTPRLQNTTAGEVEEGIHAARMLFSRCWFDADKCAKGIDALMNYRRDYDQRGARPSNGMGLDQMAFKATPVHDWASHGADAFRGLAVRHQSPREPMKFHAPHVTSWMGV